MNIVISGGTGLIGRRLVSRLVAEGHQVVVLSRQLRTSTDHVRHEVWNGKDPGPWTRAIDAADVIVNLSGASLAGGWWTDKRKRIIRESRVHATRAIVEALLRAPRRPRVLINASAVGYYGSVEEGLVTEASPSGGDFLSGVCRDWEEEAHKAQDADVRVALLRSGVVLDPSGGALARMAVPFRLFIGGPLGSGRQWFPWIHPDDMVGAILHIIGTPSFSGPVNLTAPQSVRMKEFASTLGRVMRRPSWAPVPSFVLKLLLGEMSGIILTGQNAVPEKLAASGFQHRFPELESALRDVLQV